MIRGSRATLVILAVVFLLAACHDNPQSPGDDILEEAARQRAAWNRQGITDYTFVFERICFCPQLAATVVVQNNQILSAEDLNTGQPLSPQLLEQVRTVPEMFDFIEEMVAADADTMTVTYDAARSFPTLISVDRIFQAADDEIALQAGSLIPAGSP